ncbi:MAG: hypothetical protein Q9191_001802 [Dirinaria sp. TL-2023a]
MNVTNAREYSTKPFLAVQPWKAVWTIFLILTAPFRLTFLLLRFIPKNIRQHPQWTYYQAVANALLEHWLSFASTIEYQSQKSLEPGSEKERFVVMNPAKAEIYSGVVNDEWIQPASTGGMWYPKLYESNVDKNKHIILHFHGGAYVIGGVRPKEGGWGREILAKAINGSVFCPQYRLSSKLKGRFPAALQDSITSYQYLLALGIPSSRIIISGDSAGGNLALALLRYLGEQNNFSLMPLPSAMLLWSPWLDLAADPYAVERHRNSQTDYLTHALLQWGSRPYRPPFLKANHPYLSPLNNPFATKVPVFMQYSTAEVLFDEQKAFYLQMREIPSNNIERLEMPNVPHDIFLVGDLLGFEKQTIDAAESAYKFLKSQ